MHGFYRTFLDTAGWISSCKPGFISVFRMLLDLAGFFFGTEGRDRTGTPVKEPDFESGASTSSATPARKRREYSSELAGCPAFNQKVSSSSSVTTSHY